MITFIDDASGKPKRVIVQVKSGHVSSQVMRDLRGTVEREQAAIGVLITLEPATKAMETEAVTAGFYDSPAGASPTPACRSSPSSSCSTAPRCRCRRHTAPSSRQPRSKPAVVWSNRH